MTTKAKYPRVKVQLVGKDGNAFAILGHVIDKMREAKLTDEQRTEFYMEATSGDYNHLLQTVMKYVNISSLDDENEDEFYVDYEEWEGEDCG